MSVEMMEIEIQSMAKQFNVDAGSLRCLVGFLRDKLSKPEAAATFAKASRIEQDAIIKQGVEAWRDHSTKVLSELMHGQSDWSQAARKQLMHDVWTQARSNGVAK